MDAKSEEESEGIYGLGLFVPAHVRVCSWGRGGKWATDVLYQTQTPALQ